MNEFAAAAGGDTMLGGSSRAMVVAIDAASGAEHPMSDRRWSAIAAVDWLDDDTLLVSAREPGRANYQIWRIAVRDRTARRITNDLNTYQDISVAGATGSAATVLGDASSTISVRTADGREPLRAVTAGAGRYDGQVGMVWTPDGRIVFTSPGDRGDLWIADGDGRNLRQLTSDAGEHLQFSITPDGKSIVFVGDVPGLARLDLDTGRRTQITSEVSDQLPHCHADGKTVLFTRIESEPTIYRVSLNGGLPSRVGDRPGFVEALAPDGGSAAVIERDLGGVGASQVGLLPLDGGHTTTAFNIVNVPILIRWTPDGGALTFLDSRRETQSIWNQPIAGGDPSEVLDLHGDRIFNFAWSRDGRLAISHGPVPTDVVLLSGLQ